jgi:hypothetical protein
VPAGKSYSGIEEENIEESKDEGKKEESIKVEGEKENEEESGEGELSEPNRPRPDTSIVAICEGQWFLVEVTSSQTNLAPSCTRLNYMVIKGANAFTWGPKPDIMVTLNEDIILDFAEIVPVNSRGHFGLKPKTFVHLDGWGLYFIFFLLKICKKSF